MTFKESIRNKLIIAAAEYKKLIGIAFIIQSKDFILRKQYILRFHEDNFLHLTGVITSLFAKTFFEKCLDGTIDVNGFICDSTNDLKGKVKEKMRHLSDIGSFFDKELVFQEIFEKKQNKMQHCN